MGNTIQYSAPKKFNPINRHIISSSSRLSAALIIILYNSAHSAFICDFRITKDKLPRRYSSEPADFLSVHTFFRTQNASKSNIHEHAQFSYYTVSTTYHCTVFNSLLLTGIDAPFRSLQYELWIRSGNIVRHSAVCPLSFCTHEGLISLLIVNSFASPLTRLYYFSHPSAFACTARRPFPSTIVSPCSPCSLTQ